MSKIIKSGQCVETHPRQLPPVDMDDFFIQEEEENRENSPFETDISDKAEPAFDQGEENAAAAQDDENGDPEPEMGETVVAPEEPEETVSDDDIIAAINSDDRRRLESVLLDFEEKPESRWNAGKEKPPVDSRMAKQETASDSEPEAVDLAHIADVAATIESLFSGAKQQAGVITEDAELKAGTILEGANKRAGETMDQAKKQADAIYSGAKNNADSIMGQANRQAETIINSAKGQANRQAETLINSAKEQSDLIIEAARQQAEKSAEKARQQAAAVVESAQKEAADTLGAAQKQAAAILEEANQQSIAIKEQARQDGLADGRQEAVNVVRQEWAADLGKALSLINEIETERMQRLASSEPELIKLAVSIAEKIIGAEIELDKSRQLEILREALSRVTTANMVTIRVHGDDLQFLNEHLPEVLSSFSEPKPVKITEDNSIVRGSCFIETDNGNLDARIKSQLDRVMTELLKVGKIE